MKKLIAILLCAGMLCSVLPAAFAANIGATTEHLKRNEGKVIFHVEDDVIGYRQSLIEMLDLYAQPFHKTILYYSAVSREAVALYRAERARIEGLTDLDDLVQEDMYGDIGANETTLDVCGKLYLLSTMDKTQIQTAADFARLQKKTLADINTQIKENFQRADYNDYYWDLLVESKRRATKQINGAKTYLELAEAIETWTDYFVPAETDEEEIFYVDSESPFFDKETLEWYAEGLEEELQKGYDRLKTEGYKAKKATIDEIIEQFHQQAAKAVYVEKIFKIYDACWDKICEAANAKAQTRKAATTSVIKKALARLDKMYLNLRRANYSEAAWDEIAEIYDDAYWNIGSADFADEIGNKYFEEIAKKFAAVKTLAQQLKADKAAAVTVLRAYVGNKKFNQSKVKAYYLAGVKKILAATTSEQVATICSKFVAALNKTIYTYRIIVRKAGSGAVSKSTIVKCGASYTVKMIPTAGYKIKCIVVDGKKVRLTNAYTFKNVHKAHVIKVFFSK